MVSEKLHLLSPDKLGAMVVEENKRDLLYAHPYLRL